ncbi:ThuA domain-containing protein [Halomontanus rarus]|uniref:ThuA domain-containing protein n=1 Tax=Halomontanus rarus TaxID=3034020 RepID=UPI001A989986
MTVDTTHVLVWSEGTAPEDVYPNDVNATIAEHVNENDDLVARAVSIDDPEQGITEDALEWADAIAWWGHLRHDDVTDETVDRVERAVRENGVGFIGLHSGHYALPFKRLLGTSGDLGDVRTVDGESERLEVRSPGHPIAAGVSDFALPNVEMFGEPYDIPEPEDVVLHSTFSEGGEFRSGVTFSFGAGRGFYLRPGHEEFRIYHDPNIRRILANAVRWVSDD